MRLKIDLHRYALRPKMRLGALHSSPETHTHENFHRQGALLRIQFEDQGTGYADCFPWPELGDLDLDHQLECLKNSELTPLLQRSLQYAKQDAEARTQKRSLFEGLKIPPSHALISSIQGLTEEALAQKSREGFSLIKLKCGMDVIEEATQLQRLTPLLRSLKLKLRLDFNHSLNQADHLKSFLDSLGEGLERIDFIEDPFPFSAESWSSLQREYRVRLALDRLPSPQALGPDVAQAISVLIIKPATQDWRSLLEVARFLGVSTVFTSYLDHPLGQLSAAWAAAQAALTPGIAVETCGLLSHTAYESHPASDALRSSGPFLHSPEGTGLGLDNLLESYSWSPFQR